MDKNEDMNAEDKIERIRGLIIRSIQSSLSREEKEELEAWRNDSPRNEEVYVKLAEQHFSEEEFVRYRQVRKADDWTMVQKKLRNRRRRHFSPTWMVRYAAVLLLGVLAIYWVQRTGENPLQTLAYEEVLPGGMKAVLELEGGEQVVLGMEAVHADNRLTARGISEKDSTIIYSGEETGMVEKHVLRVPRGAEYMLTLSDDTKVWMNSESVLRYPSRFQGEERRVYVEGEAYFQVAKNEAKPFIVETSGVAVRVTGTEFNVMAYPDCNRVETTLVEGSIDVEAGGLVAKVTPGMQAVYFKESNELDTRMVNTDLYTSWKNGVFEFKDIPLGEIAGQLARWYDVKFEFADREIADVRFTGAVKKMKPLEFILDIIRDTRSVNYRIEGKNVIIYKK